MKINPADHIRLITRYASKYSLSSNEQFDDLFQEGYLGLHRASEKFDPALGYQFSSFAIPHIIGAITHYLRDKSNLIKSPRTQPKIVCQSLDKLLYSDDSTLTLLDTIANPESIEDDYTDLYAAINTLSHNQRMCTLLSLRGQTREEISKKLKISRQYVTCAMQRSRNNLRLLLSA